jgi:phage tail-like protein
MPDDPAVALRFEVVVDGVDIGSFTGCDGLAAEIEVLEYQEGGQNDFVHRIPGRMKYPLLKLTRPVDARTGTSSGGLATWFSQFPKTAKRRTASITALDSRGRKLAQWSLVDVYPSKWTGPTLAADGNTVPKETLELAHNGFIQ